jgi:4'-phosphopantetheinyl transferase EntD
VSDRWQPLLAGLVPVGVRVAEAFGPAEPAALFPEEAAAVATAPERRRREFAAVRGCARAALVDLGVPAAAVPPAREASEAWARRAPVWPDGIAGSMTHCRGYRAAAVARRDVVASLGVDAEPHGPLPGRVLDRVTLTQERDMLLERAAERDDVAWDRVLFSAKESVFKAWFPLTRRWLRFEECRVDLRADGTLRATLLVPGPTVGGVRVEGFDGRWRALARHVATVVAMPAQPAAAPAAGR